MPHRSDLGAEARPPTYRSLKDHVDYMLRSCLNVLDAS
jgi:hypothetical protein